MQIRADPKLECKHQQLLASLSLMLYTVSNELARATSMTWSTSQKSSTCGISQFTSSIFAPSISLRRVSLPSDIK